MLLRICFWKWLLDHTEQRWSLAAEMDVRNKNFFWKWLLDHTEQRWSLAAEMDGRNKNLLLKMTLRSHWTAMVIGSWNGWSEYFSSSLQNNLHDSILWNTLDNNDQIFVDYASKVSGLVTDFSSSLQNNLHDSILWNALDNHYKILHDSASKVSGLVTDFLCIYKVTCTIPFWETLGCSNIFQIY